jgi:two-component system, LuxR family, sensor histidine kinase DctS
VTELVPPLRTGANPPEPRRGRGALPWHSSIALLVAATVGAAIWLSVLGDQRQQQDRLTRQANYVALQIRGRLAETEQLLLLEGSSYASSHRRFRDDMDELMQANPALLRVELRNRGGSLRAAIDAPPPRPTLPEAARADLGVEAAAALEVASRTNRLSYSRPYFVRLGETGFDLLELVVPTGDANGPLLVATYAPQRMLDYFLPNELRPNHLYSLVEADGTVVARQSSPGQARGALHAESPLARSGTTLQLRIDGLQQGPRLIPNLLTGLVAATSAGLGIAMFLLVRDVRRRASAEQALREQVRFRLAVEDAMIDALLVMDLQGRIFHVNATACRITGYSREELLGAGPEMPFRSPQSAADYLAYRGRIARAGDDVALRDIEAARGFETVYRRRSGELFPARVFEAPVHDGEGQLLGRLFIGVDLQDQRRVEDLARRQQEALQSRSRLATLGEMASTLSHELNQPLAAITSYAAACENLTSLTPARPESIRQALHGIRTQAERAGQVIRSVQSFLRRRAVERSDVDLAALVRGLEPLLNLQAARSGARIDIDVPAGTSVFADRTMLEQVLLNLTRNGFEAMHDVPPDQRLLELNAAAADERGERVIVSVLDRGRGVPPEAVPQLFTAFFTTKREGMGLGLSLCRSVIEQHGGQLHYRPRDEGGSVFAFDLPRHGEPSASARADASLVDTQPGERP